MSEKFRRLIQQAAERGLLFRSEVDAPATRAIDAAHSIGDFDLAQLDAGRITGAVAELQGAFAEFRALGGPEEPLSGLTWVEQARTDTDLSRAAKQVAAWLDKNSDGEIVMHDIGRSIHASPKAVRDALNELASWAYVDLRPSIRAGAIRIDIIK